jgi:peptidoglycan hydrolase-like protein with peptidoglycan-binding domain
MPAPTPPSADEATESPAPSPSAPSRHARTLAIGSLALAVVLGVTYGQVTGSLSDVATAPTGDGAAQSLERESERPVEPSTVAAGLPEAPEPSDRAEAPGAGERAAAGPSEPVAEGGPPAATTGALALAVARLREDDRAEDSTRDATGAGTGSGASTGADAESESEPGAWDDTLSPGGRPLALGDRGDRVRALEDRLHELGYWPGERDGRFDQPTRQAVIAFQKAEELGDQDGVAGDEVVEVLATASFDWGRTRSGEAIEVDRRRQLLFVVRDGAVVWTFNTATDAGPDGGPGRGLSDLARGRYRVERQIDAAYEAPTGPIHRPKYFDGTVSIHGTGELPDPPPQGCACLTDAAMDMLWSIDAGVPGTLVVVY